MIFGDHPPSSFSMKECNLLVLKKGLGMETSPPDKAPPPEHLAWRLQAACQDADTNLFMIMDSKELNCPPNQVASLNKTRLAIVREEFCDHCPVTAECNDSAVFEGSHVWSLRGGITPYERDGLLAGRPRPDGIYKANTEADNAAEVMRLLRGSPLDGEIGKDARRRYLREVSEGPQTAFWEPHEVSWTDRPSPVPAGSGWALSQDRTGSTLLVAHRTGKGLKTRYVYTSHTTFDREGTPRFLIEGYPNGVMLPKGVKQSWKSQGLPVESGLASPPRVWLD